MSSHIIAMLFFILAGEFTTFSGADNLHRDAGGESRKVNRETTAQKDITIDSVYFAQTHVLEQTHPYFRLVGGRKTLIKVHVLSKTGAEAPPVSVSLQLNGESKTIDLSGPSTLPKSFVKEPGKVIHRFDDCFTATIPGNWIRKGLALSVHAGKAEKIFDSLEIGPSIRLNMVMFDIHYFDYRDADFRENWVEEIAIRRPVTSMTVQRTKRLLFPKLLIAPRGGKPAILCSSREDYRKQTGNRFDGEQDAALKWMRALQDAGGQRRLSLFYANIANVRAGGFAEDLYGCSTIGNVCILHHELGHALDVEDLSPTTEPLFPYRGTMYGIPKTDTGGYHIGPSWGYDHRIGVASTNKDTAFFISPISKHGNRRNKIGEWKSSPVRGGGSNEPDTPNTLNIFSDWSVLKMQVYLERTLLKWNPEAQGFTYYNDYWGEHRKLFRNDGVSCPVEHDVDVYSIMASASAVTPDANFIYPLIGPYRSGLIDIFDPGSEDARRRARRLRDFADGWDVCLRVVQGGVTRTYMMPLAWRPDDDPLDAHTFQTRALNVPASDGKVTRAELLLTPDAEVKGLPANPKVLYARDFEGSNGSVEWTRVDFGEEGN